MVRAHPRRLRCLRPTAEPPISRQVVCAVPARPQTRGRTPRAPRRGATSGCADAPQIEAHLRVRALLASNPLKTPGTPVQRSPRPSETGAFLRIESCRS
jgi:hypothetical protein